MTGALAGAPRYLLLFSLVFLGVTACLCLWRGILGPKFTDRIVAINMIGTKTILLIAALALFLSEGYLLDVCLIYALISFLAVVVLSKTYLIAYNRNAIGRTVQMVAQEVEDGAAQAARDVLANAGGSRNKEVTDD